MKTLIITAHPSTKGFAHQIAQTYKSAVEASGGAVRMIDLYKDTKYIQPFLVFEDVRGQWSGQEAREQAQKDIAWADELVFAYPMWWSGMPAVLKNFLDNNFTAGFAFKYENGRPKGLLTDKSVRLFVTADGPKVMYAILKPALWIVMSKAIFGFCGMKVRSFDIFANMTKLRKVENALDKMLETVRAQV